MATGGGGGEVDVDGIAVGAIPAPARRTPRRRGPCAGDIGIVREPRAAVDTLKVCLMCGPIFLALATSALGCLIGAGAIRAEVGSADDPRGVMAGAATVRSTFTRPWPLGSKA